MARVKSYLFFRADITLAVVDTLVRSSNGHIVCEWHAPIAISYLLNNNDYQHIATRYQSLPDDAPVYVLLMWIDDDSVGYHHADIAWSNLLHNHGVTGTVDTEELVTYESAFIERMRDEERSMLDALPPIVSVTSMSIHPEIESLTMTDTRRVTRDESFAAHRRNSQQARDMITRGQQASAERRAAALQAAQSTTQEWLIDWRSTIGWTCPDPNGQPICWSYPAMESRHLWETICWVVTHRLRFWTQYREQYTPSEGVPILVASRWLSYQPAFRALIQEAASRHMTFPKDVFGYIRNYVLGRDDTTVQLTVPWADPAASHQTEELSSFAAAPLVVPEAFDPLTEYGQEFRSIEL